jgi:hypothetical protein
MTVIVGGFRTFILEPEVTELVNQPREEAVTWTNLAILAATLAVNLAAARVLHRKEDNVINRIIIWDCLINIVTMFAGFAVQPLLWSTIHSKYLCSVSVFINFTLLAWNRLLPVGIAVFRYLLVCTVQCSSIQFSAV